MTSVSIRRQPGAISSRSETIAHRVPDYISIRMGLSRVASRDSSTTMLLHTCDSKQSQGYVQENCKAWVEVVFESMIDSRASRRFVVCSTQSRFFRPVAVKRIIPSATSGLTLVGAPSLPGTWRLSLAAAGTSEHVFPRESVIRLVNSPSHRSSRPSRRRMAI